MRCCLHKLRANADAGKIFTAILSMMRALFRARIFCLHRSLPPN
jgi:hypothetical protein